MPGNIAPMRIAVWHNLPSGGGKRALYNLVRGLAARGHEITAWCPPTADPDYLPLNSIVHEKVLPLERVALPRPLEWVLHQAQAKTETLSAIQGMMTHAAQF